VASCLRSDCVAWLALDETDNQVEQFLAYVIAAFQSISSAIGQTAQVILDSSINTDYAQVVIALLNDSATSASAITLVLDDYHLITERAIHDLLTTLLDRAPPQLSVVVITRHDPPLPLARWRVRNQLTEVRAADLRFSHDEVSRFLATTMQLELSDAAVRALEQRTEGWIAGLQLAALSLRGQPDPEAFIERFSGSDRFVADYLIEEVIEHLPLEARLFLLCTSVLQRFNADLCAALLANLVPLQAIGMPVDASAFQDRIEALDAANLFIVPLDQQRVWYRYHHLFADLLQSRLRREYAEIWLELHRRASLWHEQANLLDAAIHHALAVGDDERVVTLIEQHGLRLIGEGFIGTLLAWMRHVPEVRFRERPLLCMVCAWPCVLSQQIERAAQLIDAGEAQVEGYTPIVFVQDGTVFSQSELVGHFRGLRAFIAAYHGQFAQAISMAQQALAGLPKQATIIHPPLYQLLGEAYTRVGQLGDAQAALREAISAAERGKIPYIAISARSLLASLLTNIGAFDAAKQVYYAAIAAGSPPETPQPIPPLAFPLLNLAWMHYRWNDIGAMDTYVARAETLARQGGLTNLVLWAALLRARRDSSAARFAQAAEWIDHAAALIEQHPRLAQHRYDLAIARARLALYQMHVAEAVQQLQQCGIDFSAFQGQDVRSPAGYRFFLKHQDFLPTLGQLLFAQERFAALHELVAWLAPTAAATQFVVVQIQSALLATLAHHAQQRPTRAQAALTEALDVAAPRNLQRVLIEFGPPIVPPLRDALPHSAHGAFLQRVLAAPELMQGSKPPVADSRSLEPLTERETQVLRLLGAGMNSTEIAAQLILAPSTVRSYIKSLYSKLNVNRRHEAVERARALNLL
jgi:LuxR family transcriptional regulator, maltose regulon positive regulatory protein